jgi:hypothetical protein
LHTFLTCIGFIRNSFAASRPMRFELNASFFNTLFQNGTVYSALSSQVLPTQRV